MHTLSVVLVVREQADAAAALGAFFDALLVPSNQLPGIEFVVVMPDRSGRAALVAQEWQRRHPASIRCVIAAGSDFTGARNAGLDVARGRWIALGEADLPLAPDGLRRADDFLRRHEHASLALVLPGRGAPLPVNRLECLPALPAVRLFRRELLVDSGLRLDAGVRAGLELEALTLRYLLRAPTGTLGLAEMSGPSDASRRRTLGRSPWAEAGAYGLALDRGLLRPLQEAAALTGAAPRWLQRAVVRELRRYFQLDLLPQSPTMVVSRPMADDFHARVQGLMLRVDVECVDRPAGDGPAGDADSTSADPRAAEVDAALLAYKASDARSAVLLDAADGEQGIVRLSYYVRDGRPLERFRVDGEAVEPVYAKYRACRFFRRTLTHQRIVWLPARAAARVEVELGDVPAAVDAERAAGAAVRLADGHRNGPPTQLPRGLQGLKVRALRWVASRRLIRHRFGRAWVFMDRDIDADDNAEHLYRWVRSHHPDVDAWFLLGRDSPDWERLKRDGFRLVSPSWWRQVLLLNCEHLISSHLYFGSLDPALYGDLMRWRFSFLQHGVTKDDMSHWLSNQPFDLFVTCGPEEHASIVADDTPYTYTAREVRRTGFPRHDRLLELAGQTDPADVDVILVMPTWRGTLERGSRTGAPDAAEPAPVSDSDYVRQWRALLGSEALRALVAEHGKKLIFMPHPNAVPHLPAFDLPGHVTVVTKADVRIQELFCRTALMITDYSSVAFEMAYLRRPVVYYQFDRERFYAGGHNWREGYYDYGRDGFGPLAERGDDVIAALRGFLADDCRPGPVYLERMERALPERDGLACQRVHDSILKIGQPVGRADVERSANPAAAASAASPSSARTDEMVLPSRNS